MPDNDSVAIVIVNYCRSEDTIECINSIITNNLFVTPPIFIVIENGSTDNSYLALQHTYEDKKNIIIKRTHQNLGFAGGYNLGIEMAINENVKWVFLLNNDTVIEENAINYLFNPDFDIVIPKILVYSQKQLIWSAGAKWKRFPPRVVISGYLQKESNQYNQQKIIKYATGCAIMITKEALLKLGKFDEEYLSYFEDYDFFFRASQLNLRTLYQPQSIIYHKVSKTLGENSKKKWFFLGRNSVLFYLKNNRFSFFHWLSYFLWVVIRDVLKGNFRLLPSFFQGVIDGINQVYFHKQIFNND